jgi:hypothetical protein
VVVARSLDLFLLWLPGLATAIPDYGIGDRC